MQNKSESEDVIPTAHANWLAHPMTKGALRAIQNHRESFIKHISVNATSSDVTDEQIRMSAMGVKTCDTIESLLYNKDRFILTKQDLLTIQ